MVLLVRVIFGLMATCLLQAIVLQPVTSWISLLTFKEGKYSYGHMEKDAAFPYLMTVKLVSSLLCVYGLGLIDGVPQSVSELLMLKAKLFIKRTWLLLVNYQALVFSLLPVHAFPPPVGRESSKVRGQAIMNMLMIVEMLVITVRALMFFRRSYLKTCQVPGLDEIRQDKQLHEGHQELQKETSNTQILQSDFCVSNKELQIDTCSDVWYWSEMSEDTDVSYASVVNSESTASGKFIKAYGAVANAKSLDSDTDQHVKLIH